MITLIIAHTTFCIPYVFVSVQSRLVGLDPAYVEAARDLGASQTRAFYDITLPLIAPAVLNGALLAFAMSMDDVVISFFVAGTNSQTLPVQVYSMLKKRRNAGDQRPVHADAGGGVPGHRLVRAWAARCSSAPAADRPANPGFFQTGAKPPPGRNHINAFL